MRAQDVPEMLRWIEAQHRAARAEAERLIGLAGAQDLGEDEPAETVRAILLSSAELAAVNARLEMWNELHAELAAGLR